MNGEEAAEAEAEMAEAEMAETETEMAERVDGFRVKVSLERYFSDERARAYMWCRAGRPVRSLARRLARQFALARPFALVSAAHLLPPAEPLALLREGDTVEVIPTKMPLASETYASERPIETHEEDSESIAPSPKARPTRALAPAPAAPPAPAEAAEAAEADEADEADGPSLADMKRRALDLLEEYSAPAPHRRRRRVRRRRPAPAPVPGSPPPPVVLRNGSASPRAARLVRPLSPVTPA